MFVMMQMAVSTFAYDFEVDGIYYNVISLPDLTCEVTYGDEKYDGDIIIPAEVEYKSRTLLVIKVGESAFKGCTSLTSVKTPSNVTEIGASAFSGCTSFTSVEMSHITKIGASAYDGCSSLNSVYFPNATEVRSCAFKGCVSLVNVELPEAIDIGGGVFKGCYSIKSLDLPNVIRMGSDALRDAEGLESINFPKLTEFEYGLFHGCKNLKNLNIPGSVNRIEHFFYDSLNYYGATTWMWDSGITFRRCEFNELTFEYGGQILKSVCRDIYSGDHDINFVDPSYCDFSISKSGFCVFGERGNISVSKVVIDRKISIRLSFRNLKELTLGEHVTSIQVNKPSETLICLGNTPIKISDDYFTHSEYLNLTVKVPKNALEAYQNAPGWRNFWNLQTLEDSDVDVVTTVDRAVEVGRYDLNGRKVSEDYKGITIVRYSDGSSRKMIMR